MTQGLRQREAKFNAHRCSSVQKQAENKGHDKSALILYPHQNSE